MLRQIIHELTVNKDAFLAIGALVSPFAVLVGVWVSVRIANKNLRGTLIIKQQQHWINEVRNEVAAVLAALAPLRADSNATRGIELMNKLELTRAKLTLLMNPKNTDHRELLDAVHHAILHAHQARERMLEARDAKEPEAPRAKEPDHLDPIFEADIDKLIDTTQKVLAEGWKKARSLK